MDDSTAVTPDTLADWRRAVAHERSPVQLLATRARNQLSTAAREEYDLARIEEINGPMLLPTPQVQRLKKHVQRMTYLAKGAQHTARQGFALSGSQRMGKSTAALYLGREHERSVRARTGIHDGSIAPVLYVSTPAESSPKQLMTAFSRTLGLPTPANSATTDRIMDQVVELMREDLKTSMVILDEIQNLRTRAAAGMAAANMLKTFTERIPALFLYVGVGVGSSDILSGPMSAQMQGRINVFEMAPYNVGSAEGRADWENIIMQFEKEFPLVEHEVGVLADAAGWLYDATGGVIGRLRFLLRYAQVDAILDGVEHVSARRVREVPLDFLAAQERKERVAGQHPPTSVSGAA